MKFIIVWIRILVSVGISAPKKYLAAPLPRIPRKHPPGPLATPPLSLGRTPPSWDVQLKTVPSPEQKKIKNIRNLHQVVLVFQIHPPAEIIT